MQTEQGVATKSGTFIKDRSSFSVTLSLLGRHVEPRVHDLRATALAPGSPCPFLPLCVWCAQRSPPLWHRAPIACGCCFTSGVLPPRWRCAAHTREIGGANCQGLGMLPTRRGVWGREEHKRSGEADVGL